MNVCSLCRSKRVEKFADFGILPLGFPVKPSQKKKVWKKKLALEICRRCKLIQTVSRIPKKLLVEENLSSSGLTKSTQIHDREFVRTIPKELSLNKDSIITEIGSGDGNLLKGFKKRGYKNVFGVDLVTQQGKKNPFEIYEGFFNNKIVGKLRKEEKSPNLVIANYIIELVPDIDRFFKNLSRLMKLDSYAVIEVPYFVDFMKKRRIDGFAHLRSLWFTISSLVYAFKKHSLNPIAIKHLPDYRGGTIRVIGRKTKGKVKLAGKIQSLIVKERGMISMKKLRQFERRLKELKIELRKEIENLIDEGVPVYAFGAGIKSSTLVNWLGLSAKEIGMAVDLDPNKKGKLIPIANIPVKPEESLFKLQSKVAVLNLAIDHTEEVTEKLKKRLKKDSVIISLLPNFKIKTI